MSGLSPSTGEVTSVLILQSPRGLRVTKVEAAKESLLLSIAGKSFIWKDSTTGSVMSRHSERADRIGLALVGGRAIYYFQGREQATTRAGLHCNNGHIDLTI